MLDMDGVLYPWTLCARTALQRKFGLPEMGEAQTWDHYKDIVTPEQWRWLWTEGIGDQFGTLSCLAGAPAMARRAALEHDVGVVTHRPRAAALATFEWLHHYKIQAESVLVLGSDIPKSSVRPSFDVYVDDKPEVCEDVLRNQPRATVLCPNRPWNSGFEPLLAGEPHPRFVRYDNPKEVTEWLERQ